MTNQEFLESITQEGEEWRDVIGYEGLYMVSSFGRVVSLSRTVKNRYSHKNTKPTELKPTPRKVSDNYTFHTISLWGGNKKQTKQLHRVVAEAFLPNPDNKGEIDHIDADPLNNNCSNLRWSTHSENVNNPITRRRNSIAHKGKSNPAKFKPIVRIKNGELVAKYESIRHAVADGFLQSKISLCCAGKRKFHAGCQWMFLSDYEASNQ